MSPSPYTPGRRCIVATGRHARTVGHIQHPPGKSWPDEHGYIGVLLVSRYAKNQGVKLFTPSQIKLT